MENWVGGESSLGWGWGNKDGGRSFSSSGGDEFVSGGIQVEPQVSSHTPVHSLPSPDFNRTLVPALQCGFSSPSPSCSRLQVRRAQVRSGSMGTWCPSPTSGANPGPEVFHNPPSPSPSPHPTLRLSEAWGCPRLRMPPGAACCSRGDTDLSSSSGAARSLLCDLEEITSPLST